jgi:AraC family transcriptional regulator, transcriptional activator FtrA
VTGGRRPALGRAGKATAERPHRVACLAFDGLAPFELGVAAEVFALPRPELEVDWWYSFAVCAERPGPLAAVGGFELIAPYGLDELAAADTVLVPGVADVHGNPAPAVLDALRTAHARGARLVSICSGAFALAAAGLLDGAEAATHWRYADLLAARFPRVRVRADALYLDGGDVLTSAGTAAGIDLCLHLIRADHGAAVANAVARRMVVSPQRAGGQAQFVEAPVAARVDDDPVGRAMQWALERLAEPVSVAELAGAAYMSPRNFSRRFAAATGTSPARWLLEQRLQASLALLEESDLPVEEVGRRVGFPTPAAFRRHFARARGIPPSAHRRAFAAE